MEAHLANRSTPGLRLQEVYNAKPARPRAGVAALETLEQPLAG
jgi:hypothetical protein